MFVEHLLPRTRVNRRRVRDDAVQVEDYRVKPRSADRVIFHRLPYLSARPNPVAQITVSQPVSGPAATPARTDRGRHAHPA